MAEPETDADFGCCVHSTDPDTGAVTLTCNPPAVRTRDMFGRLIPLPSPPPA